MRRREQAADIDARARAPDRAGPDGRAVQGAGDRRSASSASPAGICSDDAAVIARKSRSLPRLARHPPRLLHARRAACRTASTRASTAASARTTTPDNVRENRARMAHALGVAPSASSPLPDPFARRGRRGAALDAPSTPRADAHGDRACRASRSASAPPTAARSCSPTPRPAWSAPRMPAGGARSPASLEATVAAMEKLGAARGRIVAAIGPLIRQPNYEVGAEFVARFIAADAGNARFFAPAAAGPRACSTCPATSPPAWSALESPRRGPRPLHLCGPDALLQLPPHHPPRRAGLRPPRQRDRARGLNPPDRVCENWRDKARGLLPAAPPSLLRTARHRRTPAMASAYGDGQEWRASSSSPATPIARSPRRSPPICRRR